MLISQGASRLLDPQAAVDEATATWPARPDLVLAFTSPVRSEEGVAAALAQRFPDATVVGCTTAGEHLSGRHFEGALVATGVTSDRIQWAATLVEQLGGCDPACLRAHVDALFARLAIDREEFDPRGYAALLFIDGLSGREEQVLPHLAEALDGIPLVGGSAGDDLAFHRTEVFCGGRAATDAAVLVLARADVPFKIIKHQHFVATPRSLAITRSDPRTRRVYEFDGRPAALAYADAIGVERVALTDALTFGHPLTFGCNGELYVRSIQRVHPDDSITFYCAIEEGMVVDVAAHEDMVDALRAGLKPEGDRPADLFIGCNCILRALEAKAGGHDEAIGAAWQRFARRSIGFDTYGEQLDGLHINQTVVGLAFWEDRHE